MKDPIIRLHALNLSARVLERFEHLFGAAGRGAAALVNETVAEVVMADMDSPGSVAILAEYRARHPGRPALLLAKTSPSVAAGDQALLKPVAIRTLLAALLKLREFIDRAAVAAPDSEDFSNTVVIPHRVAPTPPRAVAPLTVEDDDCEADTPTVVMRRTLSDEPAPKSPLPEAQAPVVSPVPTTPAAIDPADDGEPATMVIPRTAGEYEATVINEALEAETTAAEEPPGTTTNRVAGRWAAYCGSREDIEPNDTDRVAELWLEADGLLLTRLTGAARQALETQRLLEIRSGTLKIFFDGASDYAYADNDVATVQAFCAGGTLREDLTVTPAATPKSVLLSRSGNPTAHWPTVESALWQAALWTYGGRLPAGVALDERVYLSRWPNFTRLVALPDALRICALWVDQPVSLLETASLLGVPQRHVFAVYGATHALGLSGPARRGADHLFATPPVLLAPRRPLLRRLVGQLRAPVTHLASQPARAAG